MRRYLNETFRPFGVPYNARYVDTVEIGSNVEPGLGLEVAVWEGETESQYSIWTNRSIHDFRIWINYLSKPQQLIITIILQVEDTFPAHSQPNVLYLENHGTVNTAFQYPMPI